MTASWILVVEDDRRLAATLERVLSAEGPLASAPQPPPPRR
jgi:DNA-binding response OmpR family regulator